MMTRSGNSYPKQDLSPKSKQRSNSMSIFQKTNLITSAQKRKRPEETLVSAQEKVQKKTLTGISLEQLNIMFEQYTNFLFNKKREGSGPLTCLDSRQENRSEQITTLENAFKNTTEQQTVENWKAVLILLVQYRVDVYTENLIPKSESTFGDALWAVQEHILNSLKKAHAENSTCLMLGKLMQYINDATLCSTETEAETKSLKAAFGHYVVFQSDHPQLSAITPQVENFLTEISQATADDLLERDHTVYSNSSSVLWQNDNPGPALKHIKLKECSLSIDS